MIRSRHIALMGILGTLFLCAVFVAMFSSATLVSRLASIDAERLARNLVGSLQSEFDLPGEPIPPVETLTDRAMAVFLDDTDSSGDEIDLFDTSDFQASEHFGTVRGYAIFTRFGQLMIAGGTPYVRSLDDDPMRAAVEGAIAQSATKILPYSSELTGGQSVMSVVIPLVRNGASRGAISVEIDRHRFEIVMEKGVQFATVFAASGTAAMGVAGIILLYFWGRTAQRAQREASFLAYSDALTRLPNRRKFEEDMETALAEHKRGGDSIAVVFSDLDNFKIVNDAYGHGPGDLLLVEIARRLGNILRNGDTLYRVSGDKFAMLLRISDGDDEVNSVASQIQMAMEKPLLPDDVGVTLGISSGFALAPRNGDEVSELMKKADLALYRAKADGRRTFRLYSDEMDTRIKEALRLQIALERALASDSLHLEYQPQIEAKTGNLVGFEALARWNDPVEGKIPPDRFIAIAEQSGLITKLGDWALRNACIEAARWPDDITIAVNLSPAQLRDPRLSGHVKSALKQSGISPARLELEVTESVMMQDTDLTQSALRTIRDLGVGLAMDDFGTGFSSLGYLTRLPLTKLKIDKSFIDEYGANDEGSAVVDSIIQLANRLGLQTTAEGVETKCQAAQLTHAGCTSLQGYYFGKSLRDPMAFIQSYSPKTWDVTRVGFVA